MPELVDPVSLWQSLPPQVKDRFGALMIANELAIMGATCDTLEIPIVRFHETATVECSDQINNLVSQFLPDAFSANDEPKCPDLNKLGIRQCTICGCTESRACPESCSWTGPTLCSSCTPQEAA